MNILMLFLRTWKITVEVIETKEKKYEEELAEDMKILTRYSAFLW